MNRKQRRGLQARSGAVPQAAGPDMMSLFIEAIRLQEAGAIPESTRLGRAVLVHAPAFAGALHLIGLLADMTGNTARGIRSMVRALAVEPESATCHSNLGNAWKRQGEIAVAQSCYRRALILQPSRSDPWKNLGLMAFDGKDFKKALTCYRHAARLQPSDPDVQVKMGLVRRAEFDFVEADRHLVRAVILAPWSREAHNDRGLILKEGGRGADAIVAHQRALRIDPGNADLISNLGSALQKAGRLSEALRRYRSALAVQPAHPQALNNLGEVQLDVGRQEEAVVQFERVEALRPRFIVEGYSNTLSTMHYSPRHGNAELLAEARRFAAKLEGTAAPHLFLRPGGSSKIRIGYVSSDLGSHPVGYFLARVFEANDPATTEIICYSNTVWEDSVTARLKQSSHGWRSIVGMGDAEAAAMIRADGVDVLVDLSGHTAGNRLGLFARRAAPVQVSWLGYFGTTGLDAMDYLLADRFVVPEDEERFYSERIWRLPDSYLCFTSPEIDVPVAMRDQRPVTFGCFNKLAKMSPDTALLWSSILMAVPGSILFLKTPALGDLEVRDEVMARFTAAGIAADRLRLEGPASRAALLAAYNEVDIALDPFPFGGGTTTAEAVWMGVPVVTMHGDRWVGRVSESILNAVGLPGLVGRDAADYRRIAVDLAADSGRRAALRQTLRETVLASPLCDGPRFARDLERAYRAMRGL